MPTLDIKDLIALELLVALKKFGVFDNKSPIQTGIQSSPWSIKVEITAGAESFNWEHTSEKIDVSNEAYFAIRGENFFKPRILTPWGEISPTLTVDGVPVKTSKEKENNGR